jgi:3-methyladenine DNA glycosylase AlkD
MSVEITPEQLAEEIRQKLRAFGKGAKDGHRPSQQEDYGVYANDLRIVVREYKKLFAKEPGETVLRVALALVSQGVAESRQVAYELVEGHRGVGELLNEATLEALGAGIDNWASVDGFSCSLVGRAWREGRVADETIQRWSLSDNLWWRRAAVVATVPLNLKSRGGTGDTARTIAICTALVADREEMVQKAISWALRELVPWDREAVEDFLREHADNVSARVRREVQNKLKFGTKNLRR